MKNSVFLNFIVLLLLKHKAKHIAIFIISIFIVFLSSSVFFIKSSIQHEMIQNLENHSDFVVQNINGAKVENIQISLIDQIKEINGIINTRQRVFGTYFFPPENVYFTIIGVDFFENNIELKKLLDALDIATFLENDSMIIGNGIKKIFDKYHYFDSYDFRLKTNEKKHIKIFKDLPKEANLIANDLIILDIEIAKEILNIKKDEASDIILDVPNDLERLNIKEKLQALDFDLRILQKSDLKKQYENIFNYKGGVFLILFIIVIFTFIIVLYQRYSQISSNEKKEISILKSLGWSIKDIIKLKLFENFVVAFMAFIFGVIFAYIFIFFFNAPLLKNIFIGFSNLQNDFILNPYVEMSSLVTLFLFFIIPFLSAVLIPVWKISAIDSWENLK